MKPGLGWRQEAGAGGPATPPPVPSVSPVSGFTGSGRRERLHTERFLMIGDINNYFNGGEMYRLTYTGWDEATGLRSTW